MEALETKRRREDKDVLVRSEGSLAGCVLFGQAASVFVQDPSTNKARKTLLSETAEQVFQIGDLELPLLVPAYVTFSAPFDMFFDMSKITTTSNTRMGNASFLRGFGLQALCPHG